MFKKCTYLQTWFFKYLFWSIKTVYSSVALKMFNSQKLFKSILTIVTLHFIKSPTSSKAFCNDENKLLFNVFFVPRLSLFKISSTAKVSFFSYNFGCADM